MPAVIVVGGAPASGKTTLAQCLAREFNVPLIAKDTIKEALMDAEPPRDRAASCRLGAIAFAVLFRVAGAVPDQGVSVLVEAPFRRALSEGDLRLLLGKGAGLVIYCSAPAEVLRQRYNDRHTAGQRHRGHHDSEVLDEAPGMFRPDSYVLDLGVPSLVVSTHPQYDPPTATISAWVREHTIL